MKITATLLVMLTLTLVFTAKNRIRNFLTFIWFLLVSVLMAQTSPNYYEGIILILGLFLPFLIHITSEGSFSLRSISIRPAASYQAVTILTSIFLLSALILQIYKNKEFIESLWVPSLLKNNTVYHFMSDYYDISLLFVSVIVILTALVSKRISKAGHL